MLWYKVVFHICKIIFMCSLVYKKCCLYFEKSCLWLMMTDDLKRRLESCSADHERSHRPAFPQRSNESDIELLSCSVSVCLPQSSHTHVHTHAHAPTHMHTRVWRTALMVRMMSWRSVYDQRITVCVVVVRFVFCPLSNTRRANGTS